MSSPRTLVALVALLALLALPSAAQAEPSSPILTGTNPESPNFSTTPQIYGRAGGVGTSVVSRAFFGPVAAASDPNSTITIYTDAACAGPVAATGTLSQLEGSGIAVAVTPGSTTEYFATQIDPDEPGVPSACSSPGLTYRHVSGPPSAPSLTGVSPASPADHNAPRLFGSAEAGATVSIYTDPACAGAPLGAGNSVAFGSTGIEVFVADNSTTTFYAAAAWAGLLSGCSATSVTYQEVTAPPQDPGGQPGDPPPTGGVSPPAPTPGRPAPPQLHTVPGGRANNAVPRVVGSAARAASFEIFRSEDCGGARAATASVAEFAAGVPIRVEPNSTTRFSAVAIDSDGERSRCSPEPVAYVEDSAAPVTRITFGPGVKTRKRTAVFRFADITGEPAGVSYACKLDGRPWKACQSPWRVPRLGVKGHLVRVRATDLAGNQETAPAKRRFKVVGRS